MHTELNKDILREIISYDPVNGEFHWRHRDLKYFKSKRAFTTWNLRFSDKKAGSIGFSDGIAYIQMSIMGKMYRGHRLAFMYMTGDWPKCFVDHYDGDGTNNSWENLSDVTVSENGRNQKLKSNNNSGQLGVYFYKRISKWMARIYVNNKCIFLGYFDDFQSACAARKSAEIKYGFNVNHGVRL